MAKPFAAVADLVVYEGFQYDSVGQELIGQPDSAGDVDAIGLTGTWTDASATNNVVNDMFIKSGSLSFSNVAPSGNHIGFQSNLNSDRYHRDLNSTAQSTIQSTGLADGSLYFSFLFEKLQNNFGADHEGLALMNGILPGARWDNNNPGASGREGFAVAAVNGSNLQAVAYDGTDGTRIVGTNTLPITVVNGGTNTSISNQEVNLIVGEISFNTGTDGKDVFKLYNATDDGDLSIDDLTLIDTIEANVDESTLSTLNLTRQVNVNYDEIRIGTTLGSVVVAIPESNWLPLALLSGVALVVGVSWKPKSVST